MMVPFTPNTKQDPARPLLSLWLPRFQPFSSLTWITGESSTWSACLPHGHVQSYPPCHTPCIAYGSTSPGLLPRTQNLCDTMALYEQKKFSWSITLEKRVKIRFNYFPVFDMLKHTCGTPTGGCEIKPLSNPFGNNSLVFLGIYFGYSWL